MKFAINRRKQDSTWETLVASSRNFFISSSENTTFMADPLGKGGKAKQNKHTVSFTTLEVWHIRLDCFSEQFQATYGSSLSWERRCFFSQLRLYPIESPGQSSKLRSHQSWEWNLWCCPRRTTVAPENELHPGWSFLISCFNSLLIPGNS